MIKPNAHRGDLEKDSAGIDLNGEFAVFYSYSDDIKKREYLSPFCSRESIVRLIERNDILIHNIYWSHV